MVKRDEFELLVEHRGAGRAAERIGVIAKPRAVLVRAKRLSEGKRLRRSRRMLHYDDGECRGGKANIGGNAHRLPFGNWRRKAKQGKVEVLGACSAGAAGVGRIERAAKDRPTVVIGRASCR